MDDRIKLAEARGWRRVPDQDGAVIDLWTFQPAGKYYRLDELPNPKHDANDCEALIDWMREQGYGFTIESWPDGDSVALYKMVNKSIADAEQIGYYDGGVSSTGRDNWKTGVCELALKALQESDDG